MLNEQSRANNVEKSLDKVEKRQTLDSNIKIPNPRPIMVRKIEDIIDFTSKLEIECDLNFTTKFSGMCVNFPLNLQHKRKNSKLSTDEQLRILCLA